MTGFSCLIRAERRFGFCVDIALVEGEFRGLLITFRSLGGSAAQIQSPLSTLRSRRICGMRCERREEKRLFNPTQSKAKHSADGSGL